MKSNLLEYIKINIVSSKNTFNNKNLEILKYFFYIFDDYIFCKKVTQFYCILFSLYISLDFQFLIIYSPSNFLRIIFLQSLFAYNHSIFPFSPERQLLIRTAIFPRIDSFGHTRTSFMSRTRTRSRRSTNGRSVGCEERLKV